MGDAHVSGACAARRAGSIPVLGTIPIEDSAGGVIHFTPPVFLFMQVWGAIIGSPDKAGGRDGSLDKPGRAVSMLLPNYGAHLTNQGEPS